MKDLLERELSLTVDEYAKVGDWGLTDDKSCSDCASHSGYFYSSCKDRLVMKLHSEEDVNVIHLETVFQNAANLRAGGCCDYLLYDADKIALCELTCTRPEYLGAGNNGGKRAKAYSQLSDSVNKLNGVNGIAKKLSGFQTREAVFAVKKKIFALEEQQTTAQSFMAPFIKITATNANRGGRTAMIPAWMMSWTRFTHRIFSGGIKIIITI